MRIPLFPVQSEANLKEVLDLYRRRLEPPRVSKDHAAVQKGRLTKVREFFGGETPAMGLTTESVDRWINARFKGGASKTTINNDFKALRTAFRMAEEEELVTKVLFKNKPPRPVLVQTEIIPPKISRRSATAWIPPTRSTGSSSSSPRPGCGLAMSWTCPGTTSTWRPGSSGVRSRRRDSW